MVVGAGPNGLAAAITIAESGAKVLVLEANEKVGGGARSAELTLPGFVHDICSAIVPLTVASPFFKEHRLEEHGLELAYPEIELAHPLDDGRVALLRRSVDDTAASFGEDARAYRRLMGPLARDIDKLMPELLGPFRIPRHPIALARYGLRGLRSAAGLARSRFDTDEAQALFTGIAAHSMIKLNVIPTAAFALAIGVIGHAYGWPAARGGSQKISDAMVSYLRSLGGEVETGVEVRSMRDVPDAKAILFDVAPRNLADIAGEALPARFLRALRRFRHGPGVCKVDWALSEPVPWRAEDARRAGTVHVIGAMEELVASEEDVWAGRHPEKPYLLVAQQSVFDPTRAPAGKHTLWGYCHVPHGSTVDMTESMEAQVERFAPGFKDVILERSVRTAKEMELYNPNYVGGDINSGVQDLRQLWTRPTLRLRPYATPNDRIFICSSSTPPGGGVHGMCGYHAARTALRRAL
ncbi:MAG TPA: NAD(P)/FAD-dependent oxidoreductase [Actinomycetota bacterium]|nr:NAD(P)/FAD-dependent oxidoreductase [Actinomycetota bacterium]